MFELDLLAAMSNKYGSKAEFVLAGGGNTSYKDENVLYIKGSGTSLSNIKPDEFVKMDRKALAEMWDKTYSDDETQREAEVLADMMDARSKGETRRPSVETLMHDLFPQKYVLHVHPALVNGLTCSVNGEKLMKELFPDAVWIPLCKPGYILALECRKRIGGKTLMFLQNHGVVFAADTVEEIDVMAENVMTVLKSKIQHEPDFSDVEFDKEKVLNLAPAIRMLYGGLAKFQTGKDILNYDPQTKSFSPDHIVYYKAEILIINDYDIKTQFDDFVAKNNYKPKIIFVPNVGFFACGTTYKEVLTAEIVFLDAIKIYTYAKSFGGCQALPADFIDFIVNWEVESYRTKVALASSSNKRLENKVAVITGAAQGIGKGIAEEMTAQGAYVVIADMNYDGAKITSDGIENSLAVAVNVTDEMSVKNMIDETVLAYGGIDIFVNNAGISIAGSLEEMQRSLFDKITAVNYTGYFLCVKYAVVPMKIQHKYAPGYMMDIIEISSKSGLTGSNKNSAYAGSKFGSIGLTQSFALELAEFNIKVNAICPGNYLSGPLWSDPEKGLLVQYLKAGKVPGAKTIDDVRKSYVDKVPLKRGCEIKDIARAIFYIVEQEYETGQAVPVTGGQEMLK
ncbi:MAG: SDR family oxidoreductase [Oscillospiraceae bacterium]|nr:SDR family oxidoreductase [Oscillospiraceae bacterium]